MLKNYCVFLFNFKIAFSILQKKTENWYGELLKLSLLLQPPLHRKTDSSQILHDKVLHKFKMKLVVLHRKDAKYIYTQTFLLELLHVVCEESLFKSFSVLFSCWALTCTVRIFGGKNRKGTSNYLAGYCPLSLWTFPLILTQHNAMHNSI